jgi:hypothetical protein
MKLFRIIGVYLIIGSFGLLSCSSNSGSSATINGHVLLPNEIDISATAEEAKIYIYLKDYTPEDGEDVLPWEAPIKEVIKREIRPLKSHRVSFEFKGLPEGVYGVSVLIDTGRPHVPSGSHNFTAFPGDYTSGVTDNVELKSNETVEVSIKYGMYVSVPDGYTAPLYFSD